MSNQTPPPYAVRTPQPWHTPTPGPIAVLTKPADMSDLVRTMRRHASRHDDTAWVHPNVTRNRDPLANLGQDLLDALGVVGLTQPRAVGERHLLRSLTHLIHGPVRHVIVDDATLLPTDVLTHLHETAVIGRVQLWLLVDTADDYPHATRRRTEAFLGWVNDTCTRHTSARVAAAWRQRPVEHRYCPGPDPRWWFGPLDNDLPLPAACHDHANDHGSGHIDCLLAWTRRALTAGHLAPGIARQRLIDYMRHPDSTVSDRWALTAAGRDLYTPGTDALRLLGATYLTLGDVSSDGSTIHPDRTPRIVPAEMRPAVARLRTSRRLSGCLDHEPIHGIFDGPGIRIA